MASTYRLLYHTIHLAQHLASLHVQYLCPTWAPDSSETIPPESGRHGIMAPTMEPSMNCAYTLSMACTAHPVYQVGHCTNPPAAGSTPSVSGSTSNVTISPSSRVYTLVSTPDMVPLAMAG